MLCQTVNQKHAVYQRDSQLHCNGTQVALFVLLNSLCQAFFTGLNIAGHDAALPAGNLLNTSLIRFTCHGVTGCIF